MGDDHFTIYKFHRAIRERRGEREREPDTEPRGESVAAAAAPSGAKAAGFPMEEIATQIGAP